MHKERRTERQKTPSALKAQITKKKKKKKPNKKKKKKTTKKTTS